MSTAIPTVAAIAQGHAAITGADAQARWAWCHQILAAKAAAKNDSTLSSTIDADIAAQCATAVGRKNPYSAQWVRAAVNAAKKWPTTPANPAECERFTRLLNGAGKAGADKQPAKQAAPKESSGSSAADKAAPTKESALAALRRFAATAMELGATADEVSEAVLAAIVTAPTTP